MDEDERKVVTRYSDGSQVVSSLTRHHKREKKTRHEEYKYPSDPSASPQIQRAFTSEDREEFTGDPEAGILVEKHFSSPHKEGWIVQEKHLSKRSQQIHVRHEITKDGKTTFESKSLGFMEVKHSDDSKDKQCQKFEDRYFHPIHTPESVHERERQEASSDRYSSRDRHDSFKKSSHREFHKDDMKENLPITDHYDASKNVHHMYTKTPNHHGEERYEVEEPGKIAKIERQWRQEQSPGHFQRMEIYKTESKGKYVHGNKEKNAKLSIEYQQQSPDSESMERTVPIVTSPPVEPNFSPIAKDEKQVRFRKTIEERREDRVKREGSIKRREELEKVEEMQQMEKRKDIEYQIRTSKERDDSIPAKRKKNSVEFVESDLSPKQLISSSHQQTQNSYSDQSKKSQKQVIVQKHVHQRNVNQEQHIYPPEPNQEIQVQPSHYNRSESSVLQHEHHFEMSEKPQLPKQKIITTPPSQYYRQKQNIQQQQMYTHPNREVERSPRVTTSPTILLPEDSNEDLPIQKNQSTTHAQQHFKSHQQVHKQHIHKQHVQSQSEHVQKQQHVEQQQQQIEQHRHQIPQQHIRQKQVQQEYNQVQMQFNKEQYHQHHQIHQPTQIIPPSAQEQKKKMVKKITFSDSRNVKDLEAKIDRAYWEYQIEEQEKDTASYPKLQEVIPQSINIRTVEGTDIRQDIAEFNSPGHIGLTLKSETIISPLKQSSPGLNVVVESPPQQAVVLQESNWMRELQERKLFNAEKKYEHQIEIEPEFRKVVLKKTAYQDHSFDDSDMYYPPSITSEGSLKKASSMTQINSVESHSSEMRNTISMTNITPSIHSATQLTHIIPVQSAEAVYYPEPVHDKASFHIHSIPIMPSPISISAPEMLQHEEPSWKSEIKRRKMMKAENNVQKMEVDEQTLKFPLVSLKKVDQVELKAPQFSEASNFDSVGLNKILPTSSYMVSKTFEHHRESVHQSQQEMIETSIQKAFQEEHVPPTFIPANHFSEEKTVVIVQPQEENQFQQEDSRSSSSYNLTDFQNFKIEPDWLLEAKRRKAIRAEMKQEIEIEIDPEPEFKSIALKKIERDFKELTTSKIDQDSVVESSSVVETSSKVHSSFSHESVIIQEDLSLNHPRTSTPVKPVYKEEKRSPLTEPFQIDVVTKMPIVTGSFSQHTAEVSPSWLVEAKKRKSQRLEDIKLEPESEMEPEWKNITLKKVEIDLKKSLSEKSILEAKLKQVSQPIASQVESPTTDTNKLILEEKPLRQLYQESPISVDDTSVSRMDVIPLKSISSLPDLTEAATSDIDNCYYDYQRMDKAVQNPSGLHRNVIVHSQATSFLDTHNKTSYRAQESIKNQFQIAINEEISSKQLIESQMYKEQDIVEFEPLEQNANTDTLSFEISLGEEDKKVDWRSEVIKRRKEKAQVFHAEEAIEPEWKAIELKKVTLQNVDFTQEEISSKKTTNFMSENVQRQQASYTQIPVVKSPEIVLSSQYPFTSQQHFTSQISEASQESYHFERTAPSISTSYQSHLQKQVEIQEERLQLKSILLKNIEPAPETTTYNKGVKYLTEYGPMEMDTVEEMKRQSSQRRVSFEMRPIIIPDIPIVVKESDDLEETMSFDTPEEIISDVITKEVQKELHEAIATRNVAYASQKEENWPVNSTHKKVLFDESQPVVQSSEPLRPLHLADKTSSTEVYFSQLKTIQQMEHQTLNPHLEEKFYRQIDQPEPVWEEVTMEVKEWQQSSQNVPSSPTKPSVKRAATVTESKIEEPQWMIEAKKCKSQKCEKVKVVEEEVVNWKNVQLKKTPREIPERIIENSVENLDSEPVLQIAEVNIPTPGIGSSTALFHYQKQMETEAIVEIPEKNYLNQMEVDVKAVPSKMLIKEAVVLPNAESQKAKSLALHQQKYQSSVTCQKERTLFEKVSAVQYVTQKSSEVPEEIEKEVYTPIQNKFVIHNQEQIQNVAVTTEPDIKHHSEIPVKFETSQPVPIHMTSAVQKESLSVASVQKEISHVTAQSHSLKEGLLKTIDKWQPSFVKANEFLKPKSAKPILTIEETHMENEPKDFHIVTVQKTKIDKPDFEVEAVEYVNIKQTKPQKPIETFAVIPLSETPEYSYTEIDASKSIILPKTTLNFSSEAQVRTEMEETTSLNIQQPYKQGLCGANKGDMVIEQTILTPSNVEHGISPYYSKEINVPTSEILKTHASLDAKKQFEKVLHAKVDSKVMEPRFVKKFLIRAVPEFSHEDVTEESAKQFTLYQQVDQSITHIHSGEAISGSVSATKEFIQNLAEFQQENQQECNVDNFNPNFDIHHPSYKNVSEKLQIASKEQVTLLPASSTEVNLEEMKIEPGQYSNLSITQEHSPQFHKGISISRENIFTNTAMPHYKTQATVTSERPVESFHSQAHMPIESEQTFPSFQKNTDIPQTLHFSEVVTENNSEFQAKGMQFLQKGEHGTIQYHQKERKTKIAKKLPLPEIDTSLHCHQLAEVSFLDQPQVSKILQNREISQEAGGLKIQEKIVKAATVDFQPVLSKPISVNIPTQSEASMDYHELSHLNINSPIKHGAFYENTFEKAHITKRAHIFGKDVHSSLNFLESNKASVMPDQDTDVSYKNKSPIAMPINSAEISQEVINNQRTKEFSVALHKFDRSLPSNHEEDFLKETIEIEPSIPQELPPLYYKEIDVKTRDFPQNISMLHYQKTQEAELNPELKNYQNILHLPKDSTHDVQKHTLNIGKLTQSDIKVSQTQGFSVYQQSEPLTMRDYDQTRPFERVTVSQPHIQQETESKFYKQPELQTKNISQELFQLQHYNVQSITQKTSEEAQHLLPQYDDSKVRDDSVLEVDDWKSELSQPQEAHEQLSWLIEAKKSRAQRIKVEQSKMFTDEEIKETSESDEWKKFKLKHISRSNSETGEVTMDLDEDESSFFVDSYQKQKHSFQSEVSQKSDSKVTSYNFLNAGQQSIDIPSENKTVIPSETQKFYQQNTSGIVHHKTEEPDHKSVEKVINTSQKSSKNYKVEYGETEMTVQYLDDEDDDEPSWKKQVRQKTKQQKSEETAIQYSLEPEFHKISLKKLLLDDHVNNAEEVPWMKELKLHPQHQLRYEINEQYAVPEQKFLNISLTSPLRSKPPQLTEEVILQLEEFYRQRKDEKINSEVSSLYNQLSEGELLQLQLYYKQLRHEKESFFSIKTRNLTEVEIEELETYYQLKREQLYGHSNISIPSSTLSEADILLLEEHYRKIKKEKETFSHMPRELSEDEITQLEEYYKQLKETWYASSTLLTSWRLSESEIQELEDYYRHKREEKQKQNKIIFPTSQLTEADILQLEEYYKQRKEKMKEAISAIPCKLTEEEITQLEQYYKEMREQKQSSCFTLTTQRLTEDEIQELEEFYKSKIDQSQQRSEVTFSTNRLSEEDILYLENFYKQKKESMKSELFIMPRILSEEQVTQLEQYYKQMRERKVLYNTSLVSQRLTETELEELEKYYTQQREEKQKYTTVSFPFYRLSEDDIIQLEDFYKQKKNVKSKAFIIPRMLTEEQVAQLEEYYKQLREEKQVQIASTSIVIHRLSEMEIQELEDFYHQQREEKKHQSKVSFPAPKLSEEDILQLEEFYKQGKEKMTFQLLSMPRELSEEHVTQLEQYYKQLREKKQICSPSFASQRLTESEIYELEIFYQQKREEAEKQNKVNFATRKLTETDILQLEEFYKQKKEKIKSEIFLTNHELSENQVTQLEFYYKQLREAKQTSNIPFSSQRLTENEIVELEEFYQQQRNEKNKQTNQTNVNYLTRTLTEKDILELEEFYKQKKENMNDQLSIISHELTEDQVSQLEQYYKQLKEEKYSSTSFIPPRLSVSEINELEDFYRRKREESDKISNVAFSSRKLTEEDILELEEFYRQRKDNAKSEFFIMPRELSEQEILELEQYYKQLRQEKNISSLSYSPRKLTETEIDELEDYYHKKRNERNLHLKVTVPSRELNEDEIIELEEYYQLQKEGKHVSSVIIPRELSEDEILQLEIYYRRLREKRVRFNDTVRVQRLSEEEIEKLEEYYKQMREEKIMKVEASYVIHQLTEEDIIELENYYQEHKKGNQTSSIIVPHLNEAEIMQLEEYYKKIREEKYKSQIVISVRGLTEQEIQELEEHYRQQRLMKQQKIESVYTTRELTEKEIIELEEYFQKKRGVNKSHVFVPRLTEEQAEQLEDYYRKMKDEKNRTEIIIKRRYLTEEEIQELEEFYRKKRLAKQKKPESQYITHKLTEKEIMELEEYFQKKREGTQKSTLFVPRELSEEEINQLEEYYKNMREEKLKSDTVVQTYRLSEREIQELEEYYSQKRKEKQKQLETIEITTPKLTENEIQELENYYKLKREVLTKSTDIVSRELSEEQIQQLEEYYKNLREDKLKSVPQAFSNRLTEHELQELENYYKVKQLEKLKQPDKITRSSHLTEKEILELEEFYKEKRKGLQSTLEIGKKHLTKEQIEQLEEYYKKIREGKYQSKTSIATHRLSEEELQDIEEYYRKKREERNRSEYIIQTRELTKKEIRELELYYRERQKAKLNEPDPCWVLETRSRMSERIQKILGIRKKENWINTEWKTISNMVDSDESWLNYIEEQQQRKLIEESALYQTNLSKSSPKQYHDQQSEVMSTARERQTTDKEISVRQVTHDTSLQQTVNAYQDVHHITGEKEIEPYDVEVQTKQASFPDRVPSGTQHAISKSISVPNLSEVTDEEPVWKKQIKERKLRKRQEIGDRYEERKQSEPEWRQINLKKSSSEKGTVVSEDVTSVTSTVLQNQVITQPSKEEFIIQFNDWHSDKKPPSPVRKSSGNSLYLSTSVPDLLDTCDNEPSWKKDMKERRMRRTQDVVVKSISSEPEWKHITLKTSRTALSRVPSDNTDKIITTTTPLNEYLKSPSPTREFYIDKEDWKPSSAVNYTQKSSPVQSTKTPERSVSEEPSWKKEVKERIAQKLQETTEIVKQSSETLSTLKLKPAEMKVILPSKLTPQTLRISSNSPIEAQDVPLFLNGHHSQVLQSRLENAEEWRPPVSISPTKSVTSPIEQSIFKASSVSSLVEVEDNIPSWKKEIIEQRIKKVQSESESKPQDDPPILVEIKSWKVPLSPTKQQLIQRSHSMSSLGEPVDNEPEWKKQVKERKTRNIRISPTRSESFKYKLEPEWKQEIQKKKTQRAMTTDISHFPSKVIDNDDGEVKVIIQSMKKPDEPQLLAIERLEPGIISQQQAASYESTANISTMNTSSAFTESQGIGLISTVSPSQNIDLTKDIHIQTYANEPQSYEATNITYAATVPLHSPGKKEIEVTPITTSFIKTVTDSPTKIREQCFESVSTLEMAPDSEEPAWKTEIKKRRSERQEREQKEPSQSNQLSLRELMHKEFYEKMQTQNDSHPVSSVIQNKKSYGRIISTNEDSEEQENINGNASTFFSVRTMNDGISTSRANIIITPSQQLPQNLEKIMTETTHELKSSKQHLATISQQSETISAHENRTSSQSPVIIEMKIGQPTSETYSKVMSQHSSSLNEGVFNDQTRSSSQMSSFHSEFINNSSNDNSFTSKKEILNQISQTLDKTEQISSSLEQNVVFVEDLKSKLYSGSSPVSASSSSGVPIKGTRKIRTVVRKLVDGVWKDVEVKEEMFPLESQPETPSDVSEITMSCSSTNTATTIRGKRKVKTIVRKLVDGEWQDVEIKEETFPLDSSRSQSFEKTSEVIDESHN